MPDYWIKLYHEIIDDPKMATLPDRLWRRAIELFLLAGRLNTDKAGVLPDTRQIAWALRIPTDELQMDLDQLSVTGIIEAIPGGWLVVNFQKRQSAASPAERKQQQREREHRKQYYDNVTDLSRNVTQSRTDTDQSRADANATAAFDVLRRIAESKGIVLSGESDIKALQEIERIGATPQDFMDGIDWRANNNDGKPVRYLSSVVGPTKYAMQHRLQASGIQPSRYESLNS